MSDPRWADWQWQLRHSVRTIEALEQWVRVTDQERRAIEGCRDRYRWQITPYYASLMDPADPRCPVRQQAVPHPDELAPAPTASVDPVGDRVFRRTNRVVHKYPDRVVMLVTSVCPVYCRHCTRKYHTTDLEGTYFGEAEAASFEPDFAYIGAHPEIRDVLLTGGDPLSYTDRKLAFILERLRAIPHVEIIRIGSRFPVLLPMRITEGLCELLQRHHPVWLSTHFNHVKEITPEAAAAIDRLIRAGVPVQNQSVLLRGVNDSVEALRALCTALVRIRVRPYYLYHCDDVVGVSRFRTTLERGRELMRSLTGHITGFAVPQYVLTTELGKIPVGPEYVAADGSGGYLLTNYRGERALYVDADVPAFVSAGAE